MSDNTKIKFKRSRDYTVSQLSDDNLEFGEPLLIDASNEQYLVLGKSTNDTVPNSIFIKGLSKDDASRSVTYDENDVLVKTPYTSKVYLKTKMVDTEAFTTSTLPNTPAGKYYVVCADSYGKLYTFNLTDKYKSNEDVGVYIDGNGVMHGGAWNDYAEGRNFADDVATNDLVGRVVCEDGSGNLKLSRDRLQPCPYVVSDTFGVTIGEGNIHVAVSGKVLVHTDDKVELGDCLAAGFNGKAVKMTRQEIINYPDRILGVVIEIPDYDTYNNNDVDGRVWIRVK